MVPNHPSQQTPNVQFIPGSYQGVHFVPPNPAPAFRRPSGSPDEVFVDPSVIVPMAVPGNGPRQYRINSNDSGNGESLRNSNVPADVDFSQVSKNLFEHVVQSFFT